MKMKYLLIGALLGSAGVSAWGQTCPAKCDKTFCECDSPPHALIVADMDAQMGSCEAVVEFHGKSKQIKDIFPEECGLKSTIVDNSLDIHFTPGDDGPLDPESG